MAKKQQPDYTNIFSKTEPGEPQQAGQAAGGIDFNQGRVSPVGVGLTQTEIEYVERLAAEHGVSKNSILRLAIRRMLVDVRDGRLDLGDFVKTPEPKKKIEIPK